MLPAPDISQMKTYYCQELQLFRSVPASLLGCRSLFISSTYPRNHVTLTSLRMLCPEDQAVRAVLWTLIFTGAG
jgi:hypothetical protein